MKLSARVADFEVNPMSFESIRKEDLVSSAIDLSVVIPVFNEVEAIVAVYESVCKVLKDYGPTWEVIFVDDGSVDGTYQVLKEFHSSRECLHVIRLRRNFGQTAALAAGFDKARGKIIIAMDGDLQNDPADIPLLVAKLQEGYDLVNGWRVCRKDPFWSRRLPSRIASRLISLITGVHLHDYGCTLKALRTEFAKELRLYGEMHRFIPALFANLGGSVTEIPVNHRPRTNGRSKYGITRTARVVLDLVTVKFLFGYSTRPGHVFGLCGILSLLSGLGITVFLGIQRLLHQTSLSERPLLLLGVLLTITGIQSISMGLLGEMLSRTYHESQSKPIYIVRDELISEGGRRLDLESTPRISVVR